jgi:hypothetical protein
MAVHNIFHMAIKIPAFLILRPSQKYPNWDVWFENILSGNPALETIHSQLERDVMKTN